MNVILYKSHLVTRIMYTRLEQHIQAEVGDTLLICYPKLFRDTRSFAGLTLDLNRKAEEKQGRFVAFVDLKKLFVNVN